MKDSEAVKRLCDVYDDKCERAFVNYAQRSIPLPRFKSDLSYLMWVAILFYPIHQENCSCSGESFGDLAKELSEDTTTRENGGEIPRWIERTSTGIPERV